MSRKDTIDSLFIKKADAQNAGVSGDKDRVRTGAIAAMGTSLKELTNSARAAARLQDQIETGSAILEISPFDIDVSFVADRIVVDQDPDFDGLVESIKTSGQQIPILVRPHPSESQRYQIAYGHRRHRAAAKLGIKVRAIVRHLTDAELVVAQGKENLERHDLSFIEKALFARRLEDQGFERPVIIAALATDKADLSRYLSVARAVPESLVHAIGPAAKVGRARWLALSEQLAQIKSDKLLADLQTREAFQSRDSEGRFALVFETLTKGPRKAAQKPTFWMIGKGQRAVRIDRKKDRAVFTVDETVAPAFGEFIASQLDELYERFQRTQKQEE